MKYLLLLVIGLIYFVSSARAQSSNETEPQPFITCPPEPTCPPVQDCTCPPVTECPTKETTRTRGRSRTGPGRRTDRTDTDRTGRTNRTRTDGPGGRTGRTNRTRTDTGRTRTGPGRTGRTNRTRTDTGRTRIGPGRTGRTNRTRTDTGRTRPRPPDCTPRLPPGCEDFITTGPVIFTTGTTNSTITCPPSLGTTESLSTLLPSAAGTTTSSPPPPLPGTTQPPPANITACLSSVIDGECVISRSYLGHHFLPVMITNCVYHYFAASGQREIPVVALQFYVAQNPYTFAREATDFAEAVSLLASESTGVDKVASSVLGISVQENGLSSVIVAVSYNTTAKKSQLQSSPGIMEAIYKNLDQLGEYYQVTDMRAVKMIAQSYSPGPSDSIKPGSTKTGLSASAIATIILSTLALTGMLSIFVIVMVKLSSGLTQKPNEKQPLLNDRRVGSLLTVIWRKKNNAIIF